MRGTAFPWWIRETRCKDEGNWVKGLSHQYVANQVMLKDHEQNRKKRKSVDVWALFDNSPGVELMWGITERDYKNCLPKLEKQVFCRPAWLLNYFVKVLNKGPQLYPAVSLSLSLLEFKGCTFHNTDKRHRAITNELAIALPSTGYCSRTLSLRQERPSGTLLCQAKASLRSQPAPCVLVYIRRGARSCTCLTGSDTV